MVVIKVDNILSTLAAIVSQLNLSVLSGKETEIRPNIFVTVKGDLDFKVKSNPNGVEIVFKLQPLVRVKKFISVYADLIGVLIRKDGIELHLDGLPDVFLEAVS